MELLELLGDDRKGKYSSHNLSEIEIKINEIIIKSAKIKDEDLEELRNKFNNHMNSYHGLSKRTEIEILRKEIEQKRNDVLEACGCPDRIVKCPHCKQEWILDRE